jgi:hypothetical protein
MARPPLARRLFYDFSLHQSLLKEGRTCGRRFVTLWITSLRHPPRTARKPDQAERLPFMSESCPMGKEN